MIEYNLPVMVPVLLLTHNRIGEEMLSTLQTIADHPLEKFESFSIPGDLHSDDLGAYVDLLRKILDRLEQGEGVLVLTDIPGATPANLANYFAQEYPLKIVCGLNLPMLLRIVNYRESPLDLLAKIAIVGANKGITKESDIE